MQNSVKIADRAYTQLIPLKGIDLVFYSYHYFIIIILLKFAMTCTVHLMLMVVLLVLMLVMLLMVHGTAKILCMFIDLNKSTILNPRLVSNEIASRAPFTTI